MIVDSELVSRKPLTIVLNIILNIGYQNPVQVTMPRVARMRQFVTASIGHLARRLFGDKADVKDLPRECAV